MKSAEQYLNLLLEGLQHFNSLKTILDSDAAYDILDNSEAEGSTWTSGGCAILAFALNRYFGYQVYVIYNLDKDNSEHFIVRDNNNNFIDYDGKHSDEKEMIERFKDLENIKGRLKVDKWNSRINSKGIPIDQKAINKLVDLFNVNNLKG
jgi:hypothetical protein